MMVQPIRKSNVSYIESSLDKLTTLFLDASSHRIGSLFLRLKLDLNFISKPPIQQACHVLQQLNQL